MIRSPRLVGSAVAACLLLGVSCSSDGDATDAGSTGNQATTTSGSTGNGGDGSGGGSGESTTTTTGTADPQPDQSPDRSIHGMLTLVPDSDEHAELVLVSPYGLAEEAVDLDLDGQPGDEAYELDRLRALTLRAQTGVTLHSPEMAGGLRAQEVLGALGFWPSDLAAEIEVGQPPAVTKIAVGDFEPSDLLDRAAAIDGATRNEVEGTEVVRWLEDRTVDFNVETPIGRVSGQAGRLALPADRVLVHTTADAEMADAIDTIGDDGSSLANRGHLGAVATALDEEGVMAAYLSGFPVTPLGGPMTPELEAQVSEDGLGPYSAYGVGGALDDGEPSLVIVLAHDNARDAEVNADRLASNVAEGNEPVAGRPWSEVLTEADIEVRGEVVIARFATEDPARWITIGRGWSPLLITG